MYTRAHHWFLFRAKWIWSTTSYLCPCFKLHFYNVLSVSRFSKWSLSLWFSSMYVYSVLYIQNALLIFSSLFDHCDSMWKRIKTWSSSFCSFFQPPATYDITTVAVKLLIRNQYAPTMRRTDFTSNAKDNRIHAWDYCKAIFDLYHAVSSGIV
jgi:hypothetical protein